MRKLMILLLLVQIRGTAQKIYFPAAYYRDSNILAQHLPELATKVIAGYQERDEQVYLDNMFRFHMLAQHYADAIRYLDSLRLQIGSSDMNTSKGIGFQFECFARTKILQSTTKLGFGEAFARVFDSSFAALPESGANLASGYFSTDLAALRARADQACKDRSLSDSISVGEAAVFCRMYNSFVVYSQVLPVSGPLLAAVENRNFIINDSVLIKTRDGSLLTAVIARKKGVNEKLPAILVFNIYNGPNDKAAAKEAASSGYVGIVANTRGKNLSPQDIEPFEHDANDAYDIIDWISRQSWSNGKVGMFGGSYLGFSQWAAVKKVHPALKTIIPQVAVGAGIDYPMANNVFMSYMLRWIHYVTNSKQTDQAEFGNTAHWNEVFSKWYSSGKSFRSLDSIEGRPNKIFQRWLQHPTHDGYWQNMVPYKNDFAKINIPVLTTTGFYDDDQRGAMYYMLQHLQYNPAANHYFLIGPYDHPGAQSTPAAVLNGYKIDSVANISITRVAYQWFDHILKDSALPGILKSKINYQVMGTNEWKHRPSLDATTNSSLKFYLGNTRAGDHYLLETKKNNSVEFIRQQVDLADRSDTAGLFESVGIISDKIKIRNGISFVSPVFTQPTEYTGSFSGELELAVNKKDLDISIDVYEQTREGKYFYLSYYLGRASFAKDRSKRQLLQPGKIEYIPFSNTMFTSKLIPAGSRLVFVVSVSKSPDWQINYGTGKDVSDETIADGKIPLQIKWYNGSVIRVPVFR
jgi:putative CocE/NonD family hydrolase